MSATARAWLAVLSRAAVLSLVVIGGASGALASRGGPDAHGYTWRDDREDGVSYTRVDFQPPPADVFVLEPGPDGSTPFQPLPWAFTFYGRTYNSFSVSEDGWISFVEELVSDPTPSRLPHPDGPSAMIAPLWEDLSIGTRAGGDFIRYQDNFTAGAFVIEWFRARVASTGEDATFQVWLYLDGRIRFQYLNVAGTHAGATIGIEAEDRSAGLEVISEGVAVDGFSVRRQSAVEFIPPAVGADCAGVLDCGDMLFEQVVGGPSRLRRYLPCSFSFSEGAEVLRTFELTELSHVSAELLSGRAGNDIFLLPACADGPCIAGGDYAERDFLPPGRYVLAVDTLDALGAEAFLVDLSCEPALRPADCGVAVALMGSDDRISSWPCLGGDSSGGEVLYAVSLPTGGDLHVRLNRPDLQVVLSEAAGFPLSGVPCFAAGTGSAWATDLPPGDYVVAVDGRAGASGSFQMQVDCGATRTRAMDCGATVSGSLPVAGELDGWSCGGPTPGGEALHGFTLDALATLAITVRSDEPLSLLLLDGRVEGPQSCLARSDDGFLSYPNAAPSPYVVVVESESGGDYELTIECQEPIGRVCTPWEQHEGDVPITGLVPFVQHGQVEMYELATPPPSFDQGWVPAPDPLSIGYARGSSICGHACLTAVDFTYFRTWVRLPENVTDFRLVFGAIDDGVEVRLNGQVASHGFLGGGVTVDLTGNPALLPGALNEVLLVQVDDCCSWNELSGTACFIVGTDPPCNAWVDLPLIATACPGEPLLLEPTDSGLENCFDVAEYRWLVDGLVVRDWDPDPRLAHVAGESPQLLTVEIRCRREPACTDWASMVVQAPGDAVLPEVTPFLRVAKDGGGAPVLDWTSAASPLYEGHFHVYRGLPGERPFWLLDHGTVPGPTWRDPAAFEWLVFYDVRSSDGCERESTD